MKTRSCLPLALFGALALPIVSSAQTSTDTRPTTPTTPATAGTPTPAPRAISPTVFDNATTPVRTAVASATAQAVATASSLEDAIRLGLVTPARPASTVAPPSVTALTAATTQASNAIVAEDRQTRAATLERRDISIARLRAANTDADRRHVIDELRERSGERLDEQRESARLVRDRLRALRDIATTIRPDPR